ncbi:MAG: regulatory protein RecX [Gemmatimonadales bacterium]|nr:MAG: regulatory protein RecX [Gemmatimonadales bacterium]
MTAESELREGALRLLVRREHTRSELTRKLTSRGHDPDAVARLLDELAAEGLQSDLRFAREHLRSRMERGYGPRKILAELSKRGVSRIQAARVLEEAEVDWGAVAQQVYRDRFGPETPAPQDRKERARRWRSMERRGFTAASIAPLLE